MKKNDKNTVKATAWAYRNFDFIAALIVIVKALGVGVGYLPVAMNAEGVEAWFWGVMMISLVPIVIVLGIVKSFLRRAILHYEQEDQIRVLTSGLLEVTSADSQLKNFPAIKLHAWSGLLSISFWVVAVFYIGLRIHFFEQFSNMRAISMIDGFIAIALALSLALRWRQHRMLSV